MHLTPYNASLHTHNCATSNEIIQYNTHTHTHSHTRTEDDDFRKVMGGDTEAIQEICLRLPHDTKEHHVRMLLGDLAPQRGHLLYACKS